MTTMPQVPVDEQMRLIMRGVEYGDENVRRTMETELIMRLTEGKPLRVYLGVDPTSPELHLGHCVPLVKLRQFQDLGHQAILVIGSFTALIGDPSDRTAARQMLDEDEVAYNARTYLEQAGRVIDISRTEVRYNADWLSPLTFRDLIPLASRFTVAQFLNRETFARRYERGDPIYLHEFFYALMQGYDAVALQADVQLGGTDQLFNIFAGRTLQEQFGQRPQVAVLTPILIGTDGHLKMSKTTRNHIPLDSPPADMYGKIMSIPDHLLMHYFELLTRVPEEELAQMRQQLAERSVNPMEMKMRLAREIVGILHSAEAAQEAEAEFARVFRRREMPEEAHREVTTAELRRFVVPHDSLPSGRREPWRWDEQSQKTYYLVDLVDLLVGIGEVPSKSEVRRLITEGAIKVDNQTVNERQRELASDQIIRVGRKRFLRIVDADKQDGDDS